MKISFIVIAIASVATAAKAALSADDQKAWNKFFKKYVVRKWDQCDKADPCNNCDFIGCDNDGNIISIDIAEGVVTTGKAKLEAKDIYPAFPNLATFKVATNNTLGFKGDCLQFPGADADTCDMVDVPGACCFKSALQSLFDVLGGEDWDKCSGKRDDMCNCNAATAIKVTCNNKDVAKTIALKNNGIEYTDSITALANVIQTLADAGLDTINLKGNSGIVPSDACPVIPACNKGSLTCHFPFDTCVPTPAPSVAPLTCEEINDLNNPKKRTSCKKSPDCQYDSSTGDCVDATPSPTPGPTAPTVEVQCSEIQGDKRSQVKSSCLEKLDCGFAVDGKNNICFERTDGNGDVICENLNYHGAQGKRVSVCSKYSHCGMEKGKRVGNVWQGQDEFPGYCFTLSDCSSANHFKNKKVREAYCTDPEKVSYASTCSFNAETATCETIP